MTQSVLNVVVAGLGGQGVLKGTDILANVALLGGYDVKKSEIKGMSQRGGSVTGDVRFGPQVFSPMVSSGEAHFLVVLEPTQVDPNRHWLRPGGILLAPDLIPTSALPHKRTFNVAMLGALSAHLPISETHWLQALKEAFEESFFEANQKAFQLGRASQTPAQNR